MPVYPLELDFASIDINTVAFQNFYRSKADSFTLSVFLDSMF